MTLNTDAISAPYEAFYIQSMLFNTTSAMRSIDHLETLFSKIPSPVSIEDLSKLLPTNLVLDELQNIVLQAGAVSRYFRPSRQKPAHMARANALCRFFGMDASSPLYSRDLRDGLEHFDERLDLYLARDIVGYIFPEYVGLKPNEDGVPGHFFRAYFFDEAIFRLLDKDFQIKPIADALISVHEHLVKCDQMGGRLMPIEN